MIDIVIPIGRGSVWGDTEELRYSLRGAYKHGANLGRLVIVGDCPKWCAPDIHLKCEDKRGHEWRDFNIFNKIVFAIDSVPDLSEYFLFMNDDHFILEDFDAASYPYYYREEDMQITIDAAIKNRAWRQSILNTRNCLLSQNAPLKMYDTHTPILYNKHKFLKLKEIDWSVMYGYGIKSLYANTNNVAGILKKDGKLFSSEQNRERILAKIVNLPCFSTSPIVPQIQRDIISMLYWDKTKYEL